MKILMMISGKRAGLWADSSTFTVSNCIFSDNLAYQGGAGIYLKDANATFISCNFSTTMPDPPVPGVFKDSNVSFQFCSFYSNDMVSGGWIRWKNTSGSMIDSLRKNTASNGGGCLYIKLFPIDSPLSIRQQCYFGEQLWWSDQI